MIQEAFLSFLHLIIREYTQVVHDWVLAHRCLDLNETVLLRGFSLPSFPLFLFSFLLLSSLLLPLLLSESSLSLSLGWTEER